MGSHIVFIAWLAIVAVALSVRVALALSSRHRGVAPKRSVKFGAIHVVALAAASLAALLWVVLRPDASSLTFLVIRALGITAGVLVLIGMKPPS